MTLETTVLGHLVGSGVAPDTDDVISVTSKEVATVSSPGKRDSVGSVDLLTDGGEIRLEGADVFLLLKIEDLDAGGGGSTEPVARGRENNGLNAVAGIESVELLALSEIPEDDLTVLTTGGAEGTIGRDSDAVDVTLVTDEVVLDVEALGLPNLDELIDGTRDDLELVGRLGGAESDAGSPVVVTVSGEGVLAGTEGVPDLDGVIAGSGGDVAVIRAEGDGEDVLGVAVEDDVGLAGL